MTLTTLDACLRCLLEHYCDLLVHAAAYSGGIGINVAEPAKLYYTNLVMGATLMEAARLAKVGKFVAIGTACSYPGHLEGHLDDRGARGLAAADRPAEGAGEDDPMVPGQQGGSRREMVKGNPAANSGPPKPCGILWIISTCFADLRWDEYE